MANYIGARCRFCRRAGKKLYIKGEKCESASCPFEKKNYAPGIHGKKRVKLSEYGLQLKEKQMAKRIYGILEKQFRLYFKKAERMSGITGENLMILLEKRLDNVVYRLGFARSRSEARQIIGHNHIMVNGRKVNIPSYIVKVGDIIEIKKSQDEISSKFKEILEITANRIIPVWLSCDREKYKGVINFEVKRENIDCDINETLIVELYSKLA